MLLLDMEPYLIALPAATQFLQAFLMVRHPSLSIPAGASAGLFQTKLMKHSMILGLVAKKV